VICVYTKVLNYSFGTFAPADNICDKPKLALPQFVVYAIPVWVYHKDLDKGCGISVDKAAMQNVQKFITKVLLKGRERKQKPCLFV
jgi:hypothetical protein